MDDILAKKNRHLFLEEKDNQNNSFIRNINYAVENIDTIKTFNDNVNSGTMQHLLETYIEQVGTEGNAWVLRLTELGESILATTSGFNYASVLTANQDIEAGAIITLPEAMKYRVGTHMLLVSWNGTVCYNGEQYEEVGAFNERSTTIKVKQNIKTGDKLEFRTVALADTASVTLALGDAIDNYPIVTNSTNTGRTIAERFSDIINVKDFGAKSDGETDDTAAFVLAASSTPIFFPLGTTVVKSLSQVNLSVLATAFDGAMLAGDVKIRIPKGHYTQNFPWTFAMSGGEKLSIKGAEPVAVIISSASVSGSAGAWTVVFTVSSTSGISVGDYALLTEDGCTAGTGAHEMLHGIWKITAVDSGTISVLNTAYCSSFPTFTLTSGKAKILTTVVKFNDCDGIVVKQGCVGSIDNIAIVGNASEYWDSSDVAGTEKGTHGVHVGNATIAQEGGNPEGLSNGSIHLGTSFGVSNFDQQGIVCSSGGAIFARWTASCSNRRRGYYAETCGSIQCKNSVGSGNYLDGYIGDFGGSIVCNLSRACGNAQNGFNSINGGDISASRTKAKGNVGSGFICTGSGEIACGNAEAANNGIDGFHCESGGAMLADSATASGNDNDGFEATGNAFIRANSAVANSNVRYGFRASSGGAIINTSAFSGTGNAALTSCEWGYLNDSAGRKSAVMDADFSVSGKLINSGNDFRVQRDSNYFKITLSSIYDTYLTCGSYSWMLRPNTGTLTPATDNSFDLGEGSKRIKQIYAANGAINTSDERDKSNIAELPEDLLRAWGNVHFKLFQFNDAISRKGQGARLHVGVVAQDVDISFQSRNIDARRYGLFCYDEWDTQEAEYNEDGEIICPAMEAGNRYGIRYEEALALECAYQRWLGEQRDAKIEALMQRISALENNQ